MTATGLQVATDGSPGRNHRTAWSDERWSVRWAPVDAPSTPPARLPRGVLAARRPARQHPERRAHRGIRLPRRRREAAVHREVRGRVLEHRHGHAGSRRVPMHRRSRSGSPLIPSLRARPPPLPPLQAAGPQVRHEDARGRVRRTPAAALPGRLPPWPRWPWPRPEQRPGPCRCGASHGGTGLMEPRPHLRLGTVGRSAPATRRWRGSVGRSRPSARGSRGARYVDCYSAQTSGAAPRRARLPGRCQVRPGWRNFVARRIGYWNESAVRNSPTP